MSPPGTGGAARAERWVLCPLCGFEFQPEDTLCVHGCPLHAHCGLIRCPGCSYEFAEEARARSWLGRLLPGRPARPAAACGVIPLVSLPPGARAELVALDGSDRRRRALSVFGLVPGAEITLVARHPAVVIRVGETELALEPEIAAEILVRVDLPPEREGAVAAREAADLKS